jgi:hypothetical protein
MTACYGKNLIKLSKVFFQVGVCALHTLGRHVVKHGFRKKKWKVNLQLLREKKNEVRDFYLLGSYPLVGRHVVNAPKVT